MVSLWAYSCLPSHLSHNNQFIDILCPTLIIHPFFCHFNQSTYPVSHSSSSSSDLSVAQSLFIIPFSTLTWPSLSHYNQSMYLLWSTTISVFVLCKGRTILWEHCIHLIALTGVCWIISDTGRPVDFALINRYKVSVNETKHFIEPKEV